MVPRPEMDSETDLELPTVRRTARLFGRAFRLRCPNCGGGPVLEHWLKLRTKCGACGLRLMRGEHDTFVGAMFILFTMVGVFAYLVIAIALSVTETTPWDLIDTGLPLLTLVMVFVFFPFAKLLWLAFDLMLRPVTPQELEWHRDADALFETERDVRR